MRIPIISEFIEKKRAVKLERLNRAMLKELEEELIVIERDFRKSVTVIRSSESSLIRTTTDVMSKEVLASGVRISKISQECNLAINTAIKKIDEKKYEGISLTKRLVLRGQMEELYVATLSGYLVDEARDLVKIIGSPTEK